MKAPDSFAEAANIHLVDHPKGASLKATVEDDDERQKGWLQAVAEVMMQLVQRDHREWRQAVSHSHPLR